MAVAVVAVSIVIAGINTAAPLSNIKHLQTIKRAVSDYSTVNTHATGNDK